LFTCFYALFIIICGVVIALSNIILSESGSSIKAHIKDLILGFWTFGGSILFICYSGFLVYRQHQEVAAKRKTLALTKISCVGPEVVTNNNTGSLYLRIGCVVFGLIGVVYYGLIFVICTLGWSKSEDQAECNTMSNFLNFITALFIFLQMWFVYCNGKIIFTGQGNIARFGLMHLCGTNLWMWLRYILYEEQETVTEIRLQCKSVLCSFEGYNEFMYTCVVEYSLICAGVAFVFWTNIDLCKQECALRRSRKRSLLTVDCSRTAEGLFGGNDACFYAFWRMKVLKFNEEKKDDDASSAELLDRILLVVGLVGEMVFTVGEFSVTKTNLKHVESLIFISFLRYTFMVYLYKKCIVPRITWRVSRPLLRINENRKQPYCCSMP
uniref:OTOP2 protein n=1 Tax=Angiostrongylus cantonensis TaxID=6313 RepID=A0A0K0D4K0_ANGCA